MLESVSADPGCTMLPVSPQFSLRVESPVHGDRVNSDARRHIFISRVVSIRTRSSCVVARYRAVFHRRDQHPALKSIGESFVEPT
jgi:hypothetical protein